jgi:hypothetical protein
MLIRDCRDASVYGRESPPRELKARFLLIFFFLMRTTVTRFRTGRGLGREQQSSEVGWIASCNAPLHLFLVNSRQLAPDVEFEVTSNHLSRSRNQLGALLGRECVATLR